MYSLYSIYSDVSAENMPLFPVITWADGSQHELVQWSDNTQRLPGSAKGLIAMSDDFDEPLEDFAEYM